jgi:hypothetical protein
MAAKNKRNAPDLINFIRPSLSFIFTFLILTDLYPSFFLHPPSYFTRFSGSYPEDLIATKLNLRSKVGRPSPIEMLPL